MAEKKISSLYLFLGIFIFALIIILVILKSRTPSGEITEPTTEIKSEDISKIEKSEKKKTEIESLLTTPIPTIPPPTTEVTSKNLSIKPAPTPWNPEDQPRKFYALDFRNLGELPKGLAMENLKLTDNGIELPPPKEGEEGKPRTGILESPLQEMDFPSNAISPLWLEKIPDGTTIFVEFSMSPDGDNWGIWHPVEVDEDSVGQIEEFYPDGRPNPNYGYTPGGVFSWGLKQWKYFKYRVTLYSETKDSPLLSGVRFFYQDSTLGEGHLAELKEEEKQ